MGLTVPPRQLPSGASHEQRLGKMGRGPRLASRCSLTFPNILLTLAHIHVDELRPLYTER